MEDRGEVEVLRMSAGEGREVKEMRGWQFFFCSGKPTSLGVDSQGYVCPWADVFWGCESVPFSHILVIGQ